MDVDRFCDELVQSTEAAIEMLEGDIMDAIYRGRLDEAANLAQFQKDLRAANNQYQKSVTRRIVEGDR